MDNQEDKQARQSQAAQPSIDTPEFMDALCEFYNQASCEDFDQPAYDAARKAVLTHIGRDSGHNLAVQSQAAPVAMAEPIGVVGTMPGTDGFTMACFKASEVPVGTKLYLAAPVATTKPKATFDALAMARNFLGWKLPKDFSPDCGISFKPIDMPHMWPIGTHLFNEDQATAMFEYCLKDVARPTDDDLWYETIRDRDTYHEWADKLAEAIAKHFGVDIGEHSNMNLPWAEALDAIEQAAPVAEAVPEGFALVPLIPTRAMQRVMDDEGWQWEDLLAVAEAITEEQYNEIAAAPTAQEVTQQAAKAETAEQVEGDQANRNSALRAEPAGQQEANERALFEKWAADQYENLGGEFAGPGPIGWWYWSDETADAWEGWLGRAGLATRCRAEGGITSKENGSALAPTTSTVSAPEEVRNAILEEAAEKLDAMNDSSGDAAAYDQREQNIYELEREHAISDCAKAIRALRTTSGKGAAA